MHHFFSKHINACCTLLILISMVLLYLPENRVNRDYDSFSEWVKKQVDENADIDKTSFRDSGEKISPELIRHIQTLIEKKLSDNQAEEKDELDTDLIRILYLAWTQMNSLPDMAASLLTERSSIQTYLKGAVSFLNTTQSGSHGPEIKFAIRDDIQPIQGFAHLSHLLIPAESGMSVSAP